MLAPLDWIREYTEVGIPTETYCEKMIMSGSNLETCSWFGDGIQDVVVGRILSIEPHPDASRLSVCQVDAGKEKPLQIVCGAANVFEGALIPLALPGSSIPGPLHGQPKQPGGVVIQKGAVRGVESMGMICAASELGFEDKVIPVSHKDGVFILPEGLVPGTDLMEALGLGGAVIDFEITPNRPDCLSILGMARETAATLETGLNLPETACRNERGHAKDFIAVEIRRPELCRRYAARVVTDVRIEESPWWLQKKLMSAGMRPINNIVDVTNYVMLEMGQPIHAFDIREIKSGTIVVDTALDGEVFTTLDNNPRQLSPGMLMIKDGDESVAIAGIMGGLDSGISLDTTTILIESANFSGDSIRATSKKLGLRTEASSRFEKGIDPNLCGMAADRVCRLIEELGAGNPAAGRVDVYPEPALPVTVGVRAARVNQVLGISLTPDEMAELFRRLRMDVEIADGECCADPDCKDCAVLKVTPPTVRQDLTREVDFIEEAARIFGYDRLPMTLPKGSARSGMTRQEKLRRLTRNTLCSLGFNEIQTLSFVSPRGVEDAGIPEDAWERNFAVLRNPLGEDNSVMRTVLTPAMLETMGRNRSRNIEKLKAFEIGTTFTKSLTNPDGLPDEQDSLAIGLYGGDADFFVVKGIVMEFLSVLGIRDLEFAAEGEYGVYHPGRCARVRSQDRELGIFGEIHPDVAERFGLTGRCYCGEFFLDAILDLASLHTMYAPLPKYPAVSRDIALVVDEDTPAGELERTIRAHGEDLLEDVHLFDIYRGAQVGEGKKSAAFSLTYRSAAKTLTDEEVAAVHQGILAALEKTYHAVLREM